MTVKISPPHPVSHCPSAMEELPVTVADEPGWQADALDEIKASDDLARKAGVDPKVLAETKKEERRGN
jgi:hypothetical protein